MAYQLGYAGGYADEEIEAPSAPVVGGPLWTPTRTPRPVRGEGRAIVRLKVAVVTWGAQGENRSRHTAAVATIATGKGTNQARTTAGSNLQARHGHATAKTSTSILTHVGDPKEDDQLILLAVAALLSGSTG